MSARLVPPVSPLTEPYWAAARDGRLVVQWCQQCQSPMFPPRAHCPSCGSGDLQWRPASGAATVYSYTVAHRPPHPVLRQQCPLVVAIVELAEGPRLVTNIVGCDPGDVEVGMPVQVTFEPVDDSDVHLPVFAPIAT